MTICYKGKLMKIYLDNCCYNRPYDNYDDGKDVIEELGEEYNYISQSPDGTNKYISGIMCYELGKHYKIFDCPYIIYHLSHII